VSASGQALAAGGAAPGRWAGNAAAGARPDGQPAM